MNQVVKYLTLLAIGTFAGLIAGGLGTSTAYALILGLVFTGITKDYIKLFNYQNNTDFYRSI